VIDVDEVQADRVMADADFAGAGLPHGDVGDLQLLGAAGLGNLDCSAHVSSLVVKRTILP
jgi:hypothetical protein